MQRRPDRMHRARHQIEHEDATFDAFFDTHYFPGEVFRFPGNRAEQFQKTQSRRGKRAAGLFFSGVFLLLLLLLRRRRLLARRAFGGGGGSSTRPNQHKATFKVLNACCVHIFIEGEEGGHFVGHFGTHQSQTSS